jgi:hypothetical protein
VKGAPAPLLLLIASFAAAQEVTPVQMEQGVRVRDAIYADMNGDGEHDIALSTSARGGVRSLRIHLRKPREAGAPFASEPDFVLTPVWTDVFAYAVGDVHPDEGAEVVLFSARGIWAWRPRADAKERAVKLAECAFLWQIPREWEVVAWEPGLMDLDRDGRVDLVVAEPDGYCIFFQTEPGRFDETRRLLVPEESRSGAVSALPVRFETRRADAVAAAKAGARAEDYYEPEPLLVVSDRVPAPQFRDWEGDGDLDLLVRTERWLYVWTQGGPARFSSKPNVRLEMPVRADRSRRFDVSYSAHVLDLDRDQRVDCAILSGDQRAKEVRTQVQFFRQAGKEHFFDKEGLPDQLLVLAGFAGQPRFQDLEDDGYPDLWLGAIRPDLLDTIRSATSSYMDVELYLFRNREGVFSRRPDLVHRARIEARGLKFGRSQKLLSKFIGDMTGNGLKDLLVRHEERKLQLLMVRSSRRGLTVHKTPLWELRIDRRAMVHIGPDRGKLVPRDLLVLEPTQVLFVRLK